MFELKVLFYNAIACIPYCQQVMIFPGIVGNSRSNYKGVNSRTFVSTMKAFISTKWSKRPIINLFVTAARIAHNTLKQVLMP